MHFCRNCNNMYYISLEETKLSYTCRNCGNTESETENICITQYKKSEEAEYLNYKNTGKLGEDPNLVNEYYQQAEANERCCYCAHQSLRIR